MLIGILWALLAGLMLGLYALPAKYTKDFREENTWESLGNGMRLRPRIQASQRPTVNQARSRWAPGLPLQ